MPSITERATRAESVLFQRYDELNALWQQAEKQLTSHHIPYGVSYEYASPSCDEDDPMIKCLGLEKKNGTWRICHGEYHHSRPETEIAWTPISECSAMIRVSATKWLPKLREAIVATSERFIPHVEKAIEELRLMLPVNPDVSIEELLAERAKFNGKPKK